MSETVSFYWTNDVWSGLPNVDFCCHHKTSPLDLSLLQRNLCLVFFLGIASFVEFTRPLPKFRRFDMFQIKIYFCQICIPVVIAVLRFLLNMLSHFHVFLPIDHSFGLRAICSSNNSYYVNWYSTWPVGCLYIPDNLFYNRDRPTLRIVVFPYTQLILTPTNSCDL